MRIMHIKLNVFQSLFIFFNGNAFISNKYLEKIHKTKT